MWRHASCYECSADENKKLKEGKKKRKKLQIGLAASLSSETASGVRLVTDVHPRWEPHFINRIKQREA